VDCVWVLKELSDVTPGIKAGLTQYQINNHKLKIENEKLIILNFEF
jgi:hypothetical protein